RSQECGSPRIARPVNGEGGVKAEAAIDARRELQRVNQRIGAGVDIDGGAAGDVIGTEQVDRVRLRRRGALTVVAVRAACGGELVAGGRAVVGVVNAAVFRGLKRLGRHVVNQR